MVGRTDAAPIDPTDMPRASGASSVPSVCERGSTQPG
ncbi:hypothetical protein PROPHIGD20-1_53 [Mycobacterium phage phiGD20-1]|nr:hypothetical protein PHIGD23-1_55 [Mycobacterium phage phiGD23-1]QPO17885.1 hypothetical protein PROPHIGD20-1_53 [Mycobacterium phage phiGD20-1]